MAKIDALKQLQALKKEQMAALTTLGFRSICVVFMAYVFAAAISTFMVTLFIDSAMARRPDTGREMTSKPMNFEAAVNYRDLKKDILARNIFNADGEVPEEADPSAAKDSGVAVFDENAACRKTSMNVELLGTIYLTRLGSSIATLQEKGYGQADVYKEGDVIIGNEQAKIHRIEQERVVVNNNGVKECLELAPPKIGGFDVAGGAVKAGGGDADGAGDPACSNIVLEETYVSSQLGEGFANILSKGRLIPHNKDTQMVGFKLIGVDPQSLFGRVCLKNGDVITQVNEISLQQPDQGFALYQAFQDERELRISLLRKGKTPMSISVQIK